MSFFCKRWSQTTHELYKQFRTDRDFSPKMFRKQMAVLKGQGWNVVEALKHNDEGIRIIIFSLLD